MSSSGSGLDDFPTEELNVGSPFDYRSHALLYVARHLPDRRAEGAEEALFEELGLLIEAAGGRTLALFTSRRATEAAAEALAPELPYTLLLQGDLPKGRLLEEFADGRDVVPLRHAGLLAGRRRPRAAHSRWSRSTGCPFPRPDDPLLQARRDRAGGRAFSVVDLPRAATLLAQGAGRLIRTADDTGVVAVLDPRLATASYRGVLLATLPPMRRSVDRAEVESFLRRALERATIGRRLSSRGGRASPRGSASVARPSRAGRGSVPSGSCLAHGDADRLEDLAALADDDGLLRVALDDDLDADVRPLPLGDPAGDGVRQLVAGLGQQLLADQLGHPQRLGRVGHHVGREERRALGQAADRGRPASASTPLPGARRDREVLDVRQARPARSTASLASARRSSTWPGLARSILFTTTTRPAADVAVVIAGASAAAARRR